MGTSHNGSTKKPVALAIDDDRAVLQMVRRALSPIDVEVTAATSAEDGLAALAECTPDIILLDYVLPEMSGLEALSKIRASHPHLPIIFMTGRGSSDTAIEATVGGVDAYLRKPLDLDVVTESVQRALASRQNASDNGLGAIRPKDHGDSIVGQSDAMQAVLTAIGRVAARDIPVLIRGESGTGKELVAHAIYRHSGRADRKFLAVNCAALTDTLLESELFGHEKGAFTGANDRHIGKFEQCDGGTIFLDEVGDMSPSAQAKVLRLLQEQAFERVGGKQTINTDVRILAATNRDLEQMCRRGRLREDLLHRLNGYTITVPPLRNRKGDIKLLLEHFLARFNSRLAKDIQCITPSAATVLLNYSWPGNVRELQMVLSKAMLDCIAPAIGAEVLSPLLSRGDSSPVAEKDNDSASQLSQPAPNSEAELDNETINVPLLVDEMLSSESESMHSALIDEVERYLLSRVLEAAKGNRSRAARMLGITRSSLRYKLNHLGISIDSAIRTAK